MIQKRRKTPRNVTEIPGEYLSDVICHPSNERDVVVLKSDLKWGDIPRSKGFVPNEGNGSKRRWSSDLVTAYVAVRRSLSTTYTAVVLGLLLRQYVSYQFGVWADQQ